jgi:hypothetical protein
LRYPHANGRRFIRIAIAIAPEGPAMRLELPHSLVIACLGKITPRDVDDHLNISLFFL